MQDWLPYIASATVSILGGGFLGSWLTHKRLGPKSKAEARSITAAAIDKDWARFQREIDRLVRRLEDAETKAERAVQKAHECEERESILKQRLAEFEGFMVGSGQARQEAAGIVAAERARK
jgi:hypothetical protein